MRKSLTFVAYAALCLTLAAPVLAEDAPTADTIVATVNGKDITLGHMIIARASVPQQYQSLPDDVLFKGILDQLVQQILLSDAYQGDVPKSVRLTIENEERAMVAAQQVQGFIDGAITDEALQAAYEARFASVEPAPEYNASHILVETQEEATAIIAELEAGADFAETAKGKSTGPSGPTGGELGWFGPGMMVAPFEEAVVAMKKGQVSAPVETRFGWHVIKLNDTRLQDVPPLSEVRDELELEIQQAAVEGYITKLEDAADIDRAAAQAIDPAIIKNTDLVEQ